MNIGYLYGFDSYPCKNGGSIHVYNLVTNLSSDGVKVHTFEPEKNPRCTTYPANEKGIRDFLDNIDLLYIRIDGWYLSRTHLKLRCMEQAVSKPIVWEINAPAEERLKIKAQSSWENNKNGSNGLLEKFRAKIEAFKFRKQILKEEQFRRKYARLVSGAICVSENLKPYAMKTLGISNCVVIPNGSDPSLFSPEKTRGELFQKYEDFFKVIYTGDSRWPWQGFEQITHLAGMARSRKHKILFIVVDSSSVKTRLEQDNLLILNRVNYFDVASYIASADAALCFYNSFSWSSYGFYLSPLKIFDYMACAKPVIASGVGQIATVIDDGRDGLLSSNDLNDIYDKILFCVENKQEAEEIGKAAREKIVNTYNCRQTAKSTLELFKSLQQT